MFPCDSRTAKHPNVVGENDFASEGVPHLCTPPQKNLGLKKTEIGGSGSSQP